MADYGQKMLDVYRQKRVAFSYLSSMFKTKPGDITDSEYIEWDTVRSGEEIAPVITNIGAGSNMNSQEIFTNKSVKPPVFSESEPFNAFDLMKRQPGDTVYETGAAQAAAKLSNKIMESWDKLTEKIKRTIELQAAQILQTGTITLYNSANVAAYTLDYKPKTAHIATTAISWSAGNATIIADIETMCDLVRDNGQVDVTRMIMGKAAFKNALANTAFAALFDKDGFNLGMLDPQKRGMGEKYQGFVNIGAYRIEIYTYNASYIDLGGTRRNYILDDNVIFLPDEADLDFRKCFGGIPQIVAVDPRFASYLPGRVTIGGAFDFRPRIFVDSKEDTLFTEIKSRPLLIPRSIDRFACLDTTV